MKNTKNYRVNLQNKDISGLSGDVLVIEDNRKRARKPLKDFAMFNKKDYGLIIRDSSILDQSKEKYIERIPVNEIFVNRELFQNRKKAFSDESTNKIIKAYKEGNFDIKVFDPVLLWRSDEDNKLYILSGHSRTEAFRQLAKIDNSFATIPAKILDVSKEKAIEIALNSNTLSTKESDIERASYYHYRLFNRGESEKAIHELIKEQEGKNANYILKLSYLNPDGRIFAALMSLERGDVQSRTILQAVAAWIGEARRRFSYLTDSHESELYDYMIYKNGYGNKTGQINSESDFIQKVQYLVMRENVMTNNQNALNPASLTQKSPFMQEYDQKLLEAEKLLNIARKDREKKENEYTKKNVDSATRAKLLSQYDALIEKYGRDVIRIKSQYNKVLEAEKAQTSLFGLGKPTITAKFEFESNEDALDWLHEEELRDEVKKLAIQSRGKENLNGLGAYEITSTNPRNLDFRGNRPTYKILNDYSHLIDKSEGKTKVLAFGDVKKTLPLIDNVIRNNYKQVEKLAYHLKGETLSQTCFNVWHWMTANIPFKNDRMGHEELRSPARSYADRKRGIDCDCFTILSSSILLNLGIKPECYVVAFNGNEAYGHIYTVVNRKFVIDGVMKEYGIHPRNITKTYIMPLSIEFLSGVGSMPVGLPQRNTQIDYLTGKDRLRHIPILSLASSVGLNGELNYDDHVRGMLAGEFIARLEALDNFRVNGFMGKAFTPEMHQLGEAIITDEFATAVLGLSGIGDLGDLGKLFKKIKAAAKKTISKVTSTAKKVAKTTGKAVATAAKATAKATVAVAKKAAEVTATVAKKVVDVVKKAITFAPRIAMLALLKLNVFKMGSRLYPAYLSESEALDFGIDKTEWQNLVDKRTKFENIWVKAGGGREALKNAIVNGRGAKIFRKNNPIPGENADEINGLGVAAAATGTAASVSFWKPLLDLLKKVDFKKLLSKVDLKKLAGSAKDAQAFISSLKSQPNEPSNAELQTAEMDAQNNTSLYEDVSNSDMANANINAQQNMNSAVPTASSMMPILLIGGAAIAGYFMLKKKK